MEELDLYKIFKELLKKWKILITFTIVGAVVGAAISLFAITPQYSSSAKIYIRGTSSLSASLADLQVGTYLSSDYEVIFKSRPVIEETIKDLKLKTTYRQLVDKIDVNTITDTRILKITCKADDPSLAKDIVNGLVRNGIDMVNEIDAKVPYVIEDAIVENETVSISLLETVLASMAGGFTLIACILILLIIFNTRISSEAEIEEKLGIPVLGSIPKSEKIMFIRGNKNE